MPITVTVLGIFFRTTMVLGILVGRIYLLLNNGNRYKILVEMIYLLLKVILYKETLRRFLFSFLE